MRRLSKLILGSRSIGAFPVAGQLQQCCCLGQAPAAALPATRLGAITSAEFNDYLLFSLCLRILGLRVLGYTGDGEKASWIKTDLAYDWAFNYKTQD